MESKVHGDSEFNEHNSVRKLFCVVLCHYIHSVKGGWQHLEETVNFLLMQREQVSSSLFSITLRANSKKVRHRSYFEPGPHLKRLYNKVQF